jgi:hypothetical protein
MQTKNRKRYYHVYEESDPNTIVATKHYCNKCYPGATQIKGYIIKLADLSKIFAECAGDGGMPDAPDCRCDEIKKKEKEKEREQRGGKIS